METYRNRALRVARRWAKQIQHDEESVAVSRENRDEAIKAAHENGARITEIALATGLTRTMIYKIINKEDA